MTTYYVDSAGSNTAPYDTWAKAANLLTTISALDAAGDIVYVRSTHAESSGSAQTCTWNGTAASPIKVIDGTNAAAPPTTSAKTGAVTTTGANAIICAGGSGAHVYIYGVIYNNGTGASAANLQCNNDCEEAIFDNCQFNNNTTNGGARIYLSNSGGSTEVTRFYDCTFKFGNASQPFYVAGNNHVIELYGGGIDAGSSAITQLFGAIATSVRIVFSGVNLSAAASTVVLADPATGLNQNILFRDCKLPGSWTGSLITGTPRDGTVIEMVNCDSGDTNYRYWRETEFGTIVSETTLVKTSGSSDGTTPLSWKMTSRTNGNQQLRVLHSPEIHSKWNDTTGSAVTVTVDILHDSATNLKDNEVWLEVMYLGTSGFPLGTWIRDDVGGANSGNILATAADQTASSATWTTSGMGNPNKQKLSVSFTPQEKGVFVCRVALGKASYTIYSDLEAQIS